MPSATGMPLAGLKRRAGALLYEALLLVALVMALGFVLVPILTHEPNTTAVSSLSNRGRIELLSGVWVGCGLYFVWFWSGGRFTLPMGTWRLRLMTSDGGAVHWPRALARYAACWIGPAIAFSLTAVVQAHGGTRWPLGFLLLNVVWALWDREHQFLHDRVAGTRLVQLTAVSRSATPA